MDNERRVMKLPEYGGADFDFNKGFLHTTPMKEAINNPGSPKDRGTLSPAQRDKVSYVMHEASKGRLKTSAGTKPISKAQELAIAYSVARRKA